MQRSGVHSDTVPALGRRFTFLPLPQLTAASGATIFLLVFEDLLFLLLDNSGEGLQRFSTLSVNGSPVKSRSCQQVC